MVCASAQATMGNAPVLGGANSVILFATSVSPVRAINLSNSPAVVSCAGCWAAGFQASIISFLYPAFRFMFPPEVPEGLGQGFRQQRLGRDGGCCLVVTSSWQPQRRSRWSGMLTCGRTL
jgi:hypothetical protein